MEKLLNGHTRIYLGAWKSLCQTSFIFGIFTLSKKQKGSSKYGLERHWIISNFLVLRDGHEQPSGMEVDDDGTLNRVANAEAQATSISSEKQVGTIDANNLQHQQLHDELEDQLSDFGDDVTPVTSQNGAILRRKLRMVIDPEDDE